MLRRALLPLALAAALACAAPPAAAAGAEALTLVAHDDGGADAWFTVEGLEGRNPALTLVPGRSYEVTLRNEGTIAHNVRFGDPLDAATELAPPGGSATVSFTVPDDASGATTYWCDPHASMMMEGAVAFEGQGEDQGQDAGQNEGEGQGEARSEGGEESSEGNDASAPGLVATLAVVAISLALWGRRPE